MTKIKKENNSKSVLARMNDPSTFYDKSGLFGPESPMLQSPTPQTPARGAIQINIMIIRATARGHGG
jgi:hypothetical protein